MSYLLVSEVNWIMPKTTLDKNLVKSMDFLEFLSCFTDLKIEELCKSENLTKTLETKHFLWFSCL